MDAMTPKLENSIDRLIKMMGMTTSDNDGQALVAIRAANSLLKKLNTDWDSVLRGKISIIADPFGDIPVVQQAPKRQPAPQPAPKPWAQPKPPPSNRPNPGSWQTHNAPGAAPGFGGTRPSAPPPPPKPAIAWPKSKEIDGFFAILSLRKYSPKITQRIRDARDRYDQMNGLMTADYMYVRDLAQKTGIGSVADL